VNDSDIVFHELPPAMLFPASLRSGAGSNEPGLLVNALHRAKRQVFLRVRHDDHSIALPQLEMRTPLGDL
jgi:hypothetical protein